MGRILVTGGAGFIGSHLCEALLARGDSVTVLDNFDDFYSREIKRENVATLASHSSLTLVEGDIRDADLVGQLVRSKVDAVVHLAARAGVRPSIDQPLLYEDVNVRGTLTLLEALRQAGAVPFVFGSSSSVYGNANRVPFSEADPVNHPISPYAATKRAGELLCYTYHHLYAIPATCLRFFTVYGPRQRPDLAIHKFTRLILEGKPIAVFGDGTMSRDFTFVKDIVNGIIRALDRCDGYHIYNLGNSSPVTVNELVSFIEETTGEKARIVRKPAQPGDVERTFANISSAERELGYRPATGLKEGLRTFVEWMRRSHVECLHSR